MLLPVIPTNRSETFWLVFLDKDILWVTPSIITVRVPFWVISKGSCKLLYSIGLGHHVFKGTVVCTNLRLNPNSENNTFKEGFIVIVNKSEDGTKLKYPLYFLILSGILEG